MIELDGIQAFQSLILSYLAVICLLGGGLIMWGKINEWRFKGKYRRSPAEDSINTDEVARSFNVDSFSLINWRGLKNMTMSFDQEQAFLDVSKTSSI